MAGTFARTFGEPAAEAPRSARWPWARAGFGGIIALLLPFTWVVQLDGCTESAGNPRTGLDLARASESSPLDLGLGLALLVVSLAGARWAGMVARSAPRLAMHVVALVATGALAFRGLSLVFGELEVRAIQPAGYLVVSALVACIADAVIRVVIGAIELRDAPDG